MGFPAGDEHKEQVRRAVDIADYIGRHISLRRQGRNLVGLCPWHEDSKPSLTVNPQRQTWKCWPCDVGGDIFTFVMKIEGVEFPEAVALLSEMAGIPMPTRVASSGALAPSVAKDQKQRLFQALQWSQQQFHRCLVESPDAEPARRYLDERGVSSESIERFEIGFAPNQWQWLTDRANSTPHTTKVLEVVGLLGKSERTGSYYDRFKGRVIFPIRDAQSRTIAFGGRILPEFQDDKSAKYINSPETPLFSKHRELYGLDQARAAISKLKDVVVVEGYTDAIMARQFGVENVVAVLGTALGEGHIRLLRRFTDRVTLILDGDEAGQRRTNQILELFVGSPLDLRVVALPDGLDPCDFLLNRGVEAWQECLAKSQDALSHKIRSVIQGIDLAQDVHNANRALEEVLATMAKATGTALNSSPWKLREGQILSRLARVFRLDEPQIRQRLTALRSRSRPGAPVDILPTRDVRPNFARQLLDSYDQQLLEVLSQHPEFVEKTLEMIPNSYLESGEAGVILNLYRGLVQRGESPEFASVMNAADDTAIKNLLVEIDESSSAKPLLDPQMAWDQLMQAYERRQSHRECQQQVQVLEEGNLTEQEELDLLHQLISVRRNQQGIER